MTEQRKKTASQAASRVLAGVLLGSLALAAGCRQDMQDQPRMFPQRSTTFFADGRSVRPQVYHTVARNEGDEGSYFYTGLMNGKEADMMPFPATMQVLERGQERFNIYCAPCHSRVGNGAGMIVDRGYLLAGNLHDARRVADPLSHYFYVMTNGFGGMPDYKAQVAPEDRWAIAAYIRALQLSQNAKLSDVPAGAKVESLGHVAEQLGYPANFAGPWPLPSTAVTPLPQQQEPANAPAHGANVPSQQRGTETLPPPQTIPPVHAPNGNITNPQARD